MLLIDAMLSMPLHSVDYCHLIISFIDDYVFRWADARRCAIYFHAISLIATLRHAIPLSFFHFSLIISLLAIIDISCDVSLLIATRIIRSHDYYAFITIFATLMIIFDYFSISFSVRDYIAFAAWLLCRFRHAGAMRAIAMPLHGAMPMLSCRLFSFSAMIISRLFLRFSPFLSAIFAYFHRWLFYFFDADDYFWCCRFSLIFFSFMPAPMLIRHAAIHAIISDAFCYYADLRLPCCHFAIFFHWLFSLMIFTPADYDTLTIFLQIFYYYWLLMPPFASWCHFDFLSALRCFGFLSNIADAFAPYLFWCHAPLFSLMLYFLYIFWIETYIRSCHWYASLVFLLFLIFSLYFLLYHHYADAMPPWLDFCHCHYLCHITPLLLLPCWLFIIFISLMLLRHDADYAFHFIFAMRFIFRFRHCRHIDYTRHLFFRWYFVIFAAALISHWCHFHFSFSFFLSFSLCYAADAAIISCQMLHDALSLLAQLWYIFIIMILMLIFMPSLRHTYDISLSSDFSRFRFFLIFLLISYASLFHFAAFAFAFWLALRFSSPLMASRRAICCCCYMLRSACCKRAPMLPYYTSLHLFILLKNVIFFLLITLITCLCLRHADWLLISSLTAFDAAITCHRYYVIFAIDIFITLFTSLIISPFLCWLFRRLLSPFHAACYMPFRTMTAFCLMSEMSCALHDYLMLPLWFSPPWVPLLRADALFRLCQRRATMFSPLFTRLW